MNKDLKNVLGMLLKVGLQNLVTRPSKNKKLQTQKNEKTPVTEVASNENNVEKKGVNA